MCIFLGLPFNVFSVLALGSFSSCVVCFCCVRFSVCSTKPRDWKENLFISYKGLMRTLSSISSPFTNNYGHILDSMAFQVLAVINVSKDDIRVDANLRQVGTERGLPWSNFNLLAASSTLSTTWNRRRES